MTQGKGVYELVLRFLKDRQGKSGRLDQEEARLKEGLRTLGEGEEVREKNEGRWRREHGRNMKERREKNVALVVKLVA